MYLCTSSFLRAVRQSIGRPNMLNQVVAGLCMLSLAAVVRAHSLFCDLQVVILTGSTLLAALCVLALKSLPPVQKSVNSPGAKLKLQVGSPNMLLHRLCLFAAVCRARHSMASVMACSATRAHTCNCIEQPLLTTWHESICNYQQTSPCHSVADLSTRPLHAHFMGSEMQHLTLHQICRSRQSYLRIFLHTACGNGSAVG